jgi:hypothetical protein
VKKFILRGWLVALAVTVFVAPAFGQAFTHTTTFTLDSAAAGIGSVIDSVCNAQLSGDIFYFTPPVNMTGVGLSVAYTDTIAAAAVVDSLNFCLLWRSENWTPAMEKMAGPKLGTRFPKGWTLVYRFPVKIANSSGQPTVRIIVRDSMQVYPFLPGEYTFAVTGGAASAAHDLDKAQKVKLQMGAW